MATEAAVPDHVDPSLVRQSDFHDDARDRAAGGVHEGIDQLRAEGAPGIFCTPEHGGRRVIDEDEPVVHELPLVCDV